MREVPVVIRACSNEEWLELALVENLQREDLNPIEAATAYQRLMREFGLSQEQVAAKVGKSRSAVANTMRLLGLPPEVQHSISSGHLSEGHGRALLAVDSAERILELWQRIMHESLSVRQTEALAKIHGKNVPRETVRHQVSTISDPNVRDLEDRLQSSLGTKVSIRPHGDGGTIEIQYYSLDDLDRIYSRLALGQTD
jgi:ParB family chromosome partitioning protein